MSGIYNFPELPGYSYDDSMSLPSPSYSCQLASGEQRLDYTPRSRTAILSHNAIFIKTSGNLTIVLNNQEENASTPVFGRGAMVSGTVLCQGRLDTIRKVVLKVQGRLDTASSAGGCQSIKLINNSYTLWSHLASQEPCLPHIPFSTTLPSTFQDGDNSFSLPPSYHNLKEGVLNMLVRSSYQLRFIVTRVRHQKFDIWRKHERITIPFVYVPRTQAPRPILNTPCLFSSVKTSPEEWHQTITCLNMSKNVKMSPIICHLFIPAGRIYGLTDTIKFHVQLVGMTCSLYMLFSRTDLEPMTSRESDDPTTTTNKSKNVKPLIRVSLLRQVSVTILGQKSWRNSTLGEGTIWPIPPDLSSCCVTSTCQPSQRHEGNIDWEGEVRCQSDVNVGGFNTAGVQVKDFIILSISPPTSTSSLVATEINVPVRLVTDSFPD